VSEQIIIKQIMLACARGACRLFRINAGVAWSGKVIRRTATTITLENPRPFRGAPVGWPDLCGWKTVEVTQEMVGTKIAVFVGIEVKSPSGRVMSHQQNFVDVIRAAGAISGVVRSPEQASRVIQGDDNAQEPSGLQDRSRSP
jgi:hypothetical protein